MATEVSGNSNLLAAFTASKREIPISKLRDSMTTLRHQISWIVDEAKEVGAFELNEIKLSVELTAEGGIELIGSAKAGVKGAIEMVFKMPSKITAPARDTVTTGV